MPWTRVLVFMFWAGIGKGTSTSLPWRLAASWHRSGVDHVCRLWESRGICSNIIITPSRASDFPSWGQALAQQSQLHTSIYSWIVYLQPLDHQGRLVLVGNRGEGRKVARERLRHSPAQLWRFFSKGSEQSSRPAPWTLPVSVSLW